MVNILFCGNDKVFDGMLTCSLSIVKRTESREPFAFYVFTMDVSHIDPKYVPVTDAQIDFYENIMKSYNEDNKVIKIDVTKEYHDAFD